MQPLGHDDDDDDDDEVMLNVLRCQLTYQGQAVTNAEARFNKFFTSTETRRLVRTDSSGRPPRLSHSSLTLRQRESFIGEYLERDLHQSSGAVSKSWWSSWAPFFFG